MKQSRKHTTAEKVDAIKDALKYFEKNISIDTYEE